MLYSIENKYIFFRIKKLAYPDVHSAYILHTAYLFLPYMMEVAVAKPYALSTRPILKHLKMPISLKEMILKHRRN